MSPRSNRNRSVGRVRLLAARRVVLGLLLSTGLLSPAVRAADAPPLPERAPRWHISDGDEKWFGPQMLVYCGNQIVGEAKPNVNFCVQSLPQDESHRVFYFSSHPYFNDGIRSAVRPRETAKVEIPTEPGEYVDLRSVNSAGEYGGRVLLAVAIVKGLPPQKRFTSTRVNYYLYDVAKGTLTLAHQGPSRAMTKGYMTLRIHGPGDELGMWVRTETLERTVTWPALHWVGDRLEAGAPPPAPKARSVHVSPPEDKLLKQIRQAYEKRGAGGASTIAGVIGALRASLDGGCAARRLAFLQEVLDGLQPAAPVAEPWRSEPPTCNTTREWRVCTTRATNRETAQYLIELSSASGGGPPARHFVHAGKNEFLATHPVSVLATEGPFALMELELTTGKPTSYGPRRMVLVVIEKTESGHQLYPGWSSPLCLGPCWIALEGVLPGPKGQYATIVYVTRHGERPTSFLITPNKGDWRRLLVVEAAAP